MHLTRIRVLITGQVQGVGFRPYVYRIANQLDLTGWVHNHFEGVLLEIQGQVIAEFFTKLNDDLPSLALIDTIQSCEIPIIKNETTFQIVESQSGITKTIISPDTSVCGDCLGELFDPLSHYYLYPFLSCIHCGPRFTMTTTLPYDRCHTAMDKFPLCTQCQQDYSNPQNRRYHAQTTACAKCGPQLAMPIDDIVQHIRQGEIVAIKGLGGYQFICDANNAKAVVRLRERKNRQAKPFALMMLNVNSLDQTVVLTNSLKQLLQGPSRPIVLAPKKSHCSSDVVAPGLAYLGVMLPYTPLHYLLFHGLADKPQGCQWLEEYHATVLLVTSANRGGQPLTIDDDVAYQELSPITDKIVHYNRLIVARADDSVVQVINDAPVMIRRARGYVPTRIKLPHAIPETLALGGHLKNTFCITRGDEAFLSQHIGDLTNKATIEFFHDTLLHFKKFLGIEPQRVAHDLHPNFYTTSLAQNYAIPAYGVQHHHAHLAAVIAEHKIQQPVIGLALDGYGYGTDGTLWGGELLLLENTCFKRLGHFYPLAQPGGDMATQQPWRMAASVLYSLGLGQEIAERFKSYPQSQFLLDVLCKQINAPFTSSCGRLFDAASAILGINHIQEYEGQAAMQLESLVTNPEILPHGWSVENNCFNMLPTLAQLFDMKPIKGANIFHGTLIDGLVHWVLAAAKETSTQVVVLSGGCFLNRVLTEGVIKQLSRHRLTIRLPQQVPPNDGGLSLGQAWVAGRI